MPLAEVRTWLLPREQTEYCWPGYVESSAPGWALVEVDGDRAWTEWRRVGDGAHVRVELLRGQASAELFRKPLFSRRRLSAADLERVRRAWICPSVDRSDDTPKTVTLQGTPVAELPLIEVSF